MDQIKQEIQNIIVEYIKSNGENIMQYPYTELDKIGMVLRATRKELGE